ncbi:MAG: hypothetical protein ACRECQ_05225, partial [Burkholderiaceae bacterium]
WRTMSDNKNKVYFFESARSPYLLTMKLADFDFSEGAPVLKLALTEGSAALADGQFVSGKASQHFKPAQPFKFLAATPLQ